jgi:hypothetical protein
MSRANVEQLRDELNRLMRDQIASLKKQTFGGLNEQELQEQQERLERIRHVSADFLAAVKRERRDERKSAFETEVVDNREEKP